MARESTPGRINTCMRERGKRGCAKAWGRSTLPMVPNIVEISVKINGVSFEENSSGDGQYDAFWNALGKIYKKQKLSLPQLIDYAVRIPPGSNSDALCETTITWRTKNKEFTTRGLDSDQTVSAIKATEKMLNII